MIKAYTFMFTENYRYFLDMQVLLTTHHISLYIGMKRVQVNSGPLQKATATTFNQRLL